MAMAEHDWFSAVVAFMSVASMLALVGNVSWDGGWVHAIIAGTRGATSDGGHGGCGRGFGHGWVDCHVVSLDTDCAEYAGGAGDTGRGSGHGGMVAGVFGHSVVVSSGKNVHNSRHGEYGRLGHGFELNELVPRWIEPLDRVRVVGVTAGASH